MKFFTEKKNTVQIKIERDKKTEKYTNTKILAGESYFCTRKLES